MKQAGIDGVILSEITSNGVSSTDIDQEFDITAGCAGIAFKNKAPVFEPFAQSSEMLTRQELNTKKACNVVFNIIAVPIFNEKGDSVGVFEMINSLKSVFSDINTKYLLMKFSKFVSLLMYTNGLLKVLMLKENRIR